MATLLDVMAVRATGDPDVSVVECGEPGAGAPEIACVFTVRSVDPCPVTLQFAGYTAIGPGVGGAPVSFHVCVS